MSDTDLGLFGTHPDYVHRADPQHFDDTPNKDEWQNEVYALASTEFIKRGYRRIADVGCGSGYKLVKCFSPAATIGIEVEPAFGFLKSKYPNRTWRSADALSTALQNADMVMSSDVIEHVVNPAAMLQCFADCPAELFAISTPALELIIDKGWSSRFGPPSNPSHVREWTTIEFAAFVAQYLTVVSHHITNVEQGTQLIFAVKK